MDPQGPPAQGQYPPPGGAPPGQPPMGYGAPHPQWGAPSPQGYGGPPPGGAPPPQGYGPPPGGAPPPQGYGPPPGGAPPPQGYGPPPPGGAPPPQGYGPPPPGCAPPPQGYGPPPPGGAPPPQGYGPPPPGGAPPPQGYGPPPPGGAPPPQGYGPPPPAGAPPSSAGQMQAVPEVKLPPPQKLPPDLPPWQPGQEGTGHAWDNLPSAPPPDDPNALPPSCPPPPMEGIPAFNGYENTGGFGQVMPLPPPPPPPPPVGEAPKMEFDDVANLSEDECRESLLAYVAEHCCYGKGCAEDMKITKIQPTTALHYILETFTEGRSTGFVHEPYRGGPIDGPEYGIPPAPWAIPVQSDMLFSDELKKVEVPHTATVKVCHMCHGRGFNRCHRCHGCGFVRCMTCHGDGRVTKHDPEHGHYQAPCHMCGADGKRRCITCGGDGRVKCNECYGYRNLKCFIQLTAKYTNHKEDHIMEKTDMPDELVRNVEGLQIFQQTLFQVWPITCYPIQEINQNSVRLVEHHRTAFPNDRYIQQRHTLRAVPVTEVHYTWKDKQQRFWVYGRERKVHAPDYPQTCCWGCTIL